MSLLHSFNAYNCLSPRSKPLHIAIMVIIFWGAPNGLFWSLPWLLCFAFIARHVTFLINSNNLKHLTKCLWYQIWPLVKAIDRRICSPFFKKKFLAAITNARNTTPEFHITVTELINFVKVSVYELFFLISYSYKVAETPTFINFKLFSIISSGSKVERTPEIRQAGLDSPSCRKQTVP